MSRCDHSRAVPFLELGRGGMIGAVFSLLVFQDWIVFVEQGQVCLLLARARAFVIH